MDCLSIYGAGKCPEEEIVGGSPDIWGQVDGFAPLCEEFTGEGVLGVKYLVVLAVFCGDGQLGYLNLAIFGLDYFWLFDHDLVLVCELAVFVMWGGVSLVWKLLPIPVSQFQSVFLALRRWVFTHLVHEGEESSGNENGCCPRGG